MTIFHKPKPFTFDKPEQQPPEPGKEYSTTCPACSRSLTLDTSKPSSGVCSCGFAVMTENHTENGFKLVTTKAEVFK